VSVHLHHHLLRAGQYPTNPAQTGRIHRRQPLNQPFLPIRPGLRLHQPSSP
jgi:hypothetical protein